MRRGGKAELWDDTPKEVAHTVHEREKDSWSGLYDHNGRKLVREELKVGFDLNERRKT